MASIAHLFDNNIAWSTAQKNKDPEYFSRLAEQQAPEILWIGCSDSRVPANQIVNLPPGEVFVHRNIANVVVHSDLNCLSVVQYAVEVLKVKHIIVCGHYGCGGVKAAIDDQDYGLINNWLQHIKDVDRFHRQELNALSADAKLNRLCELNVIEQVYNVANTTIAQNAWHQGQDLSIHGWIYSIDNGLIKNLEVSLDGSVAKKVYR